MNQPRILIADDDFDDRLLISQTFRELGHANEIKLLEEGAHLIDYLMEEGADSVKLIILDMNMPRLNGTETLRILKSNSQYKHIPVVIFSTSTNRLEEDICLELGAYEFIVKPTKYVDYPQICKKFYELSQSTQDYF